MAAVTLCICIIFVSMGVGMTCFAVENGVVIGVIMALGANVPGTTVSSGINWEELSVMLCI